MGTTWRPRGCGDNMGTTWGPQGCGDHVGTTWRKHEDNVETTWGQHGDHGDVETTWGQHGDNMGQHEDNVDNVIPTSSLSSPHHLEGPHIIPNTPDTHSTHPQTPLGVMGPQISKIQ